MSDEYDKTGNEALSAQRAVQLFGLQGEQLSAIYKNGRINLDEFANSVQLMTDKTLESMARIERQKERFKRTMEGIFGGIIGEIGRESSSVLGAGVTMEAMAVVGETGGTSEQEGRSIGGQIYSELKGDEDAIAEAIKQLQDYEEDDWFTSQAQYEAAAEAIKTIRLLQENEKKAKEAKPAQEGPPLLQAARVMAVSSLQDIGGGDVGSILSGTYQTSMLDAANKTAENTAKLVQETGKPPVSKPNNVAK
jgi:hypothetical protein